MSRISMITVVKAVLVCLAATGCTASTYVPGCETLFGNATQYEIFNTTNDAARINASVSFIVDTASALGSSSYYYVSGNPIVGGMEVEGVDADLYSGNGTNIPLMVVAMTLQKYSETEVKIFMYCGNIGADNAYNIELYVDLNTALKAKMASFDYISINYGNPAISDITLVSGRSEFIWNVGNLTSGGDSKNASFVAELVKPELSDKTWFDTSLTYYQDSGVSTQVYGPMIAQVCIEKEIIIEESVLYQHGFTALTFFMALILGIVLVTTGICIYFIIRRKKAVSPSKVHNERVIQERGKTIMMNDREASKKDGHTINDYSIVGEGDSIVGVLAMKDKNQMHREIDSLDIVNTVNIDTGIEQERNDASIATTELLTNGLLANKDIDKMTKDTAINNMRSRRTNMDRQHDEDYKRELKKLYKKISAKNRAMMNSMLQKQRNEKKELVSATQNLPEKDRNDLLNVMNDQHLTEQNAEIFRLKLEQDEETEKLRKEHAIGVRMGIKEVQMQALADIQNLGKLSDTQYKWLLSEHSKTQKALEAMYDEEISKQRMKLEEKLAKRRALAQAGEVQEDDNDYILNTIAGQQITTIGKLKKSKVVSAATANEMIDEAKKQMVAIKDRMEKERQNQEMTLHKKLTALKKARLSDLAKEQELEIKEYDRKSVEMQTEGPIDPVTYADGRLKLLSQQREERAELENQIDQEQTLELTKLRDEITTQTEQELYSVGTALQAKIPDDGNADDIIAKMIRDHKHEVDALRASQERNRQKQLDKLRERLEQNQQHWNQRKEAERVEQQQLREYEDQVVSKLVNSQVSMSEEERIRILKEHEKHMVTLENSLTLNKLRQKRMLEEKLALRRAQQLEKLQQKQNKEKEIRKRQMENNGEDSDDESQAGKAEMLKEHVEQKMAVLQGKKLDWDTELESIRVEMLKERSLALKEQEERLGALVAELQLSKAKELAKIEEQQLAIHNLKTSLIDDLNARGVLSDPETQAVIKRHQEEQEHLNRRLEAQRVSQEQALKQKLQLRLEQREKSMIQQQDEELKQLMAPNKTAAKIKKMLLIHNHMVAMEKFRNQLDREISQTLEQVRYEYEILKRKAIQDQELEFIAGLVRVGAIPKEELESVLHMLYPTKSEAEFKEIFAKIFDPKWNTDSKNHEELYGSNEFDRSHLAERVRQTQQNPPPLLRRASQMSMIDSMSSRKSSLRKSKKKPMSAIEQQQMYDDHEYDANARFRPSSRQSYEDHPHPLELGQPNGHAYANPIMEENEDVVQAQYVGDNDYGTHHPPHQLPPIQRKAKKKKKSFLKKVASPRVDDDY